MSDDIANIVGNEEKVGASASQLNVNTVMCTQRLFDGI